MGKYYPLPGLTNMEIHLFLATKLTKTKQNLDANEFIDIHLVPLSELEKKIINNDHKDLPSITSFLLYNLGKKQI